MQGFNERNKTRGKKSVEQNIPALNKHNEIWKKINRRALLRGIGFLVTLSVASELYFTTTPLVKANIIQSSGSGSTIMDTWNESPVSWGNEPRGKIYPIRSLSDLKEFMVVAAHPYNIMEGLRSEWGRIFDEYGIQFLDRGTALDGVSYIDQFDSRNVEFAIEQQIPIASYLILHPLDKVNGWSFADKYYNLLPDHEKWRDPFGNIILDPFEGGGAKDIYGIVLRKGGGERVVMSLNNPNWFNYQMIAAEHAIDSGINVIDMDMMENTPFMEGGDFSEWSIQGFREYLASKFSANELRDIGVADVSQFDIKTYLLGGYIGVDGTQTYSEPMEDPLLREFVKFNYHTLIGFHNDLSSLIKEYGTQKGLVVPYFGNLYMGDPSYPLYKTNNSILLSRAVDIIQLETQPAVPPRGRAVVNYKIARAMSEKTKPVWSLHMPFYIQSQNGEYDTTKSLVGLNKLWLAECYATGVIPEVDLGGWPGIQGAKGLFVKEDGSTYPELKRYLDFAHDNEEHLKDVELYSRVGLVYSIPSFMWRKFPLLGIGHSTLRRSFVGYARAMEEAHIQYETLIFGMPEFWDDTETLEKLTDYNTLILPNVYSVTDNQLQAIRNFLLNDGKLICIGNDSISRDEEYAQRNSHEISQVLDGRPNQVFFIKEKFIRRYYRNTVSNGIDDDENFQELIAPLPCGSEMLVETDAPRSIGVNVLKQEHRIIIHFVNYDYDPEADSSREKTNITFKINAISPEQVSKVTLISPDHDKIRFIENPTELSFLIPKLKTWNTIIVE